MVTLTICSGLLRQLAFTYVGEEAVQKILNISYSFWQRMNTRRYLPTILCYSFPKDPPCPSWLWLGNHSFMLIYRPCSCLDGRGKFDLWVIHAANISDHRWPNAVPMRRESPRCGVAPAPFSAQLSSRPSKITCPQLQTPRCNRGHATSLNTLVQHRQMTVVIGIAQKIPIMISVSKQPCIFYHI